jgi:hypothetical protein
MNGRFEMQGGKNWFLPKEMNANRFFWDSHWLEIWSNHFYPSMGPNGGSVAMDSQVGCPYRKVERQVNIWLFSFYFPPRSFCRYHSKFSCWKLLPKKQKEQRQIPVHFEFFAVFLYCLHFAKFVCLLKLQRLKQEWQKSPAGTRQTYGKN